MAAPLDPGSTRRLDAVRRRAKTRPDGRESLQPTLLAPVGNSSVLRMGAAPG
jgi:hypothetical protein